MLLEALKNELQEKARLMSTETLYFWLKMPELQSLKVGYPHHKILHLSCKVNSYKTELVHHHQPLIIPEGISVRVRSISWGEPKFSAIFAFWAE